MPNSCSKAITVSVTPLLSVRSSPDIKITNAVVVQTTIVSIKGPNIATNPSLTGSIVLAAPWANASVPAPASFENNPLLTPVIIIVPTAPPTTA